jgi:BASS family bile acid:Na+ symporter
MGRVAIMGLAPAVFGPMIKISGSSLANWWRKSPVYDRSDTKIRRETN